MINDVVSLSISLDPPPVGTAAFKLMVAGQTAGFTERIRWYSSAAELLADGDAGISSSDYEYLALVAIFSQDVHPDQVGVGRCDTSFVAQVDEWTIDTAAVGVWSLVIDGNSYDYTAGGGDTATDIRDNLVTAAAASPRVTVASGAGATLTVTADVAGVSFTSTITPASGGAATKSAVGAGSTANLGWPEELAAVFAADDDPYYICIEDRDQDQVYTAGVYMDTLKKVLIAQSANADIKDATKTEDAAYRLKAGSYFRTGLAYFSDDAAMMAESWAGKTAAADPDVVTTIWALKTLTGITPDTLTTTEQNAITGKNASFYETVGGVGSTWEGNTPNGKFIDMIITVDWIYFRLREDIWRWYLAVSNRNEKIPYDDDGIQAHGSLTRTRLEEGFNLKHVNSNYTVTMPRRADVSAGDIAARSLAWSFAAEFAGAIQKASITGYVTTTLPA